MDSIKPILETDRLVLRRMNPSDARDFWLLNRDIANTQFTGDPPFSGKAEARRFIQAYTHYEKYNYGRWNVYLKSNGTYLGFCGLKHYEEHGETDIGYRIRSEHWGKGYATEGAKACIEHGFEKFGLKEIVAWTKPENKASIRVLEKIGMQELGLDQRYDEMWTKYTIRQ